MISARCDSVVLDVFLNSSSYTGEAHAAEASVVVLQESQCSAVDTC